MRERGLIRDVRRERNGGSRKIGERARKNIRRGARDRGVIDRSAVNIERVARYARIRRRERGAGERVKVHALYGEIQRAVFIELHLRDFFIRRFGMFVVGITSRKSIVYVNFQSVGDRRIIFRHRYGRGFGKREVFFVRRGKKKRIVRGIPRRFKRRRVGGNVF